MGLTTLACTIDSTGISAPSFSDVLESLNQSFRQIYGTDVYLGPDSQDEQWITTIAQAITDVNNACIAVYNSFSPVTGRGNGLSSNVKLNGLQRISGQNSTAPVLVSGVGGTVIRNGRIGDNVNLNTTWALPATVTIPQGSGSVTVEATCEQDGAVSALASTLTVILTPTNGWATVTNTSGAAVGTPTESDSLLRQRQSVSTSLPAQGPAAAALAAIKNIPGVTARSTYYENPTTATDGNGIPARSIAFVIEGGDPVAIATALSLKKFPGTATVGSTTEVITDQAGVNNTINFYALTQTSIDVVVNVKSMPGWVTTTASKINRSVANFINNLNVGEKVYLTDLYSPANLNGDAATSILNLTQQQLDNFSDTFTVTSITLAVHGNAQGTADIAIAFNAAAITVPFQVTVNVS